MASQAVSFRISSALKTIIGKELITDEFIAIFELVKNSFDAHARRVDITFEGLESDSPKIVIQDDGDGMDEGDIRGKWLFVAYSTKQLQEADYRDKIQSARIFAGAKGIGRFSCDRLGGMLSIYTRKRGDGNQNHVLTVNWNHFERDPEKEFQRIPAKYARYSQIPYKLSHGTVLEITDLRPPLWDREKFQALRGKLERLVNPNQENDSKNFSIYLHVPQQMERDREDNERHPEEPWRVVNGRIHNFLFEELGLRTTQIDVLIGEDARTIRTRLEDRGTLIYDITEKNIFIDPLLHSIRAHLFFLNRAAKLQFSKQMGLRTHDYGSVFLYKNGFRIHPFGDPGQDSLGIDSRKQQGFFRFLGTRDLSGRVEINGTNPEFKEASSRDGGLIQSRGLIQLREFIWDFALKRLEAFVIGLQKFSEHGDLPDPKELSKGEIKQTIFDIVVKLTKSTDILSLDYDPKFLNILENRSAESVAAMLSSLKRIAVEQDSRTLNKEVDRAEKHLRKLSSAKVEAEAEATREREKTKRAEKEAEDAQRKAQEAEEIARKANQAETEARNEQKQLSSQNLFLKSVISRDLDHVVSLHHSVGIAATTIENHVNNLLTKLREGRPVTPEAIEAALDRISYVAKRIAAITRFATRANFTHDSEEIPDGDLLGYIREYLLNVYEGVVVNPDGKRIPIHFVQPNEAKFICSFAPIEVCIIFDNLISNARKTKHKVSAISVEVVECTTDRLAIKFRDDGVGVPKRNQSRLFEIGFTTTDGSGLGLYHVRQILSEMNGSISLQNSDPSGTEFLIEFKK
jgi:signal transduction histidine kinase